MSDYKNFDRRYKLIAGKAGKTGFEIGSDSVPLHISFAIEKSDLETQNTGKIDIWNLSKQHIAELEQKDCVVALSAGYGDHLSLIFAGKVNFVSTVLDSSDTKTHIEVIDNLIEARDTYISVSYAGKISWKKIIDDVANAMGVVVKYASNAKFSDTTKGYSYVGLAKNVLNKACDCCGLTWNIQNGVIHVKKPGDAMSRTAFELSAETGMIEYPEKVTITDSDDSSSNKVGWDVNYFLNGAINVDDYVRLVSKNITGYFYVSTLQITGDNVSGDWICKARLIQLTEK